MDDNIVPELMGIATRSIVENAPRLGLVWNVRIATVLNGLDSGAVSAIYNGDTNPIDMVSMVGPIAAQSKVYVLQVPPSGNYIVGGFAGFSLGETGVNLDSASGETVSTTTMASIPNSTFTFVKYGHGRVRIDMTGTFFTTAATTGAGFGVAFNSVDYLITGVWHNLTANAHTTFAGNIILDPFPPGAYTVVGIWRASINAAGPTRDSSDFLSIIARELAT